MYDVIIIGAGPAGLFAAYELLEKCQNLNLLIIEKGKATNERKCFMELTGSCAKCKPCNILAGVGGAGTFSGGILNLRPDIGGNLEVLTKNKSYAWELVDYVDKIFLRFGASKILYGTNENKILELKKKSLSAGISFIDIKQRYLGRNRSSKLINRFADWLRKKNAKFLLNCEALDLLIENNRCMGVKLRNKNLRAKKVLVAPGRVGSVWFERIIRKYKVNARYRPIDVGIRIEVPSIILEHVVAINRDPKFHIRTAAYDDFVRTFCTNPNGFVVKENYDGLIGVNGQSLENLTSSNTNFALLVRIELTEPVENTIEYGRSIAKLATTIGGGNPIIQRMGDLRRDRRSTSERLLRNPVKSTLSKVTPGDISMALPHRVVANLLESLERLDNVMPGVAADSTLLYAPEIKYYSIDIKVTSQLEVESIKNLFVAGDGAGLSRDIVNASATGILAGRGIIEAF
jgi:hypothetical protein